LGFAEAQKYLDELGIDAMKSMKPTLHRIEALLDALDNPQQRLHAIHITGTNGKTSVARISTSLLVASGLSVGTYTSPHLQSMTERIAHNGQPISEEMFGEVFDHLLPYVQATEATLGEKLSYFEVMTALFFLWAADQPVDVAVVEVGLGGKWDATNVIEAPVAVITNIGLDHTELLGDRTSIATEKSGIIKPQATVVTAERDPEILAVLATARDDAQLVTYQRDFSLTDNKVAFGGRYLSVATRSRNYDGLFLPLHGAHQGVNAATALEAVVSFLPPASLDDEVVAEGLAQVTAPGRIETIKTERGEGIPVILDVAHNPDGISALVGSLSEAFAFDRVIFVVGILRDKDQRGMIAELTRVPSAIVFTEPRFARSARAESLRESAAELGFEALAVPDVASALDSAFERASSQDLICVTGSHYVVGEARGHLLAS
jgi:dihydrofolate synthase / folylpolyglutamate synthase